MTLPAQSAPPGAVPPPQACPELAYFLSKGGPAPSSSLSWGRKPCRCDRGDPDVPVCHRKVQQVGQSGPPPELFSQAPTEKKEANPS